MFKKLRIKILSVALLVSLMAYSGDVVYELPQQFPIEFLQFDSSQTQGVHYALAFAEKEHSFLSVFLDNDFKIHLMSFNNLQLLEIKEKQFQGLLLKERRLKINFQTSIHSTSEETILTFIQAS